MINHSDIVLPLDYSQREILRHYSFTVENIGARATGLAEYVG
jgi:hypothetical protein